MEYEEGIPLIMMGDKVDVRRRIHQLSFHLQYNAKKVLLIDTLNAINPHDKVFKEHYDALKNVYCVRAENPYDLSARLATASPHIEKKEIKVLLINSLNSLFVDVKPKEIEPLFNIIWLKILELTKRHDLITILGLLTDINEEDRIPELLLARGGKFISV